MKKYKYNYNKKTKNKSKIILFCIILLLIIISLFFGFYLKSNTNGIIKYMYYPVQFIKDKINMLKNNKDLLKENKELLLTSKEYSIVLDKNKELQSQIDELKELLELKNIYTDYNIINATVISRNQSYWFNELIIDKGLNNNIKTNMAVVTKDGLIGRINNVYEKTSTVKMITNNDTENKISVAVQGKDGLLHGIITNYDYDKNYIVVTGLTAYDTVEINSEVITTGLGIFPKGIKVGIVKKIEKDNYNISKILYVEPFQDINNIEYVSILGNEIND